MCFDDWGAQKDRPLVIYVAPAIGDGTSVRQAAFPELAREIFGNCSEADRVPNGVINTMVEEDEDRIAEYSNESLEIRCVAPNVFFLPTSKVPVPVIIF